MRSRNGSQQEPLIERELAVVDAALAGKPVEADFDELAELVRVVRAERPRPRPGFGESLDARVREGFQAQEPRKAPKRRRWMRTPLAAASAASLLIVATAVVSSGVLSGDGGGEGSTSGGGAPATVESEPSTAAPEADAPAADSQAFRLAPPKARVLPQIRNRQVERDAALTLATSPAKLEDTADGVIEVTDRYQGFVLRSNITGGDKKAAGATLDLRIPTDRLQPALRDLSGLAHVRSRTQSSQDITARFVSARSRLRDATTERRALLRQLAHAKTPNEAASIRARLGLANRQIAAARSNLRGLRNRVNFSSVAVTVVADDSLPAGDGGWTPGDAVRDAVDVLGVTAGVILVAIAVLLPLTAVAVVFFLAYRRITRARRDRVLDF